MDEAHRAHNTRHRPFVILLATRVKTFFPRLHRTRALSHVANIEWIFPRKIKGDALFL